MGNDTEIIRTIQVEDKTVHVHIHLTEDEIRRLLLPQVASVFAGELRRQTKLSYVAPVTSTNSGSMVGGNV